MSRLIALALLACGVMFCPPSFAQASCEEAVRVADIDFTSNQALERCAATGDTNSEALLGMMYWGATSEAVCDGAQCTGGYPEDYGLDPALGVTYMRSEGLRLLTIAANKNHAVAQNELGNALLNGEYGQPVDPVAARSWFKKSAANGDDIAPFNLARIYMGGYGVKPSPGVGEYYLRMSVMRNYRPAKCSLMALLGRQQHAVAKLESLLLFLSEVAEFNMACTPFDIMSELS